MKLEPKPAIHMEKPLLTAWVGLQFGWDRASGDLQGGANNVSQVDGVSDTAPACWLCDYVGVGFRKRTMASATFLSGRKVSHSSHLDARHFSSSLYTTGAFQAATPVLKLRGSQFE